MSHTCPARHCQAAVPDHYLMCGAHWRLVPAAYQRAVWAAYDHGRGLGSLELAYAQTDAIAAVNDRLMYDREGKHRA